MEDVRQRRPLRDVKSTGRGHQNERGEKPKSDSGRGLHCMVIFGLLVSAFLVYSVLLPAPIEPQYYRFKDPPTLNGTLKPNEKLTKSERLFENKVFGPESMAIKGDYLYAGTADGKIVEIYKGEMRTVAKLGKDPCGGFDDEPTCGRPLGMRFDKDGYLVVLDGYLGIFRVNVATGSVHMLLSSKVVVQGHNLVFLNDFDFGPDGTMYISQTSTKWDRRHNRYSIMELETTGRLLSFNPKTNITKVIAEDLAFVNGVQMSHKGDSLLVMETGKSRVHRYYLTGNKMGKLEMFMDNLPGFPDNIRKSHKGGYWIGFAATRDSSKFSFVDFAATKPWLKKILFKFVSQEFLMKFAPKYGLVIEINEKGDIVQSLHDPTGERVPSVSEIEDQNGVLYFGSYNLPYLSKLYTNT